MSASVLTFPVGSDETIDYVGRVRALGALERGTLEEHRRWEDVDDGRAGEGACNNEILQQ